MDFLKSLLANTTDAASSFDLSAVHPTYQQYTSAYLKSLANSYLPDAATYWPALGAVAQRLYDADLVTLLALLLAVFVGFKVLDYLRRLVIFWIVLAIKIVVLMVAVQVGIHFYAVGWEQSLQDLGRVWGWLEGVVSAYS